MRKPTRFLVSIALPFLAATGAVAAPRSPAPAVDRDRDGVPDGVDRCPDAAGPRATGGCPDGDSDGLADDDEDACPSEPGPIATAGCPDVDGDGIADIADHCPNDAGDEARLGCPAPSVEVVDDPKIARLAGRSHAAPAPPRRGHGTRATLRRPRAPV